METLAGAKEGNIPSGASELGLGLSHILAMRPHSF